MERLVTRLALALLLGGCFPDDPNATYDAGPVGFAGPTLELTVNGVHFGPSTPDSSSGAALVTTRDQTTGVASQSTLTINVSSAATGASCSLGFARYGDGVNPFHAAGYTVSSASALGATPDGEAQPIAGEAVGTPQGNASCNGTDCDGAVLNLNDLTPDHVQGSLSGTMQNNGVSASVVCSFYIPTRAFSQ
jgi:hypothetical protein